MQFSLILHHLHFHTWRSMVKAKFLSQITFILWKSLKYPYISYFFSYFQAVSYSQWLIISQKGQTLAMIYYLLISERLCLSTKGLPFTYSECIYSLTVFPEMLTSSRRVGCFYLYIRIKTPLSSLWSCICPCFSNAVSFGSSTENSHITTLF